MIALTGTTGNIGRHLLQMFATSGTSARLLVRDQASVSAFLQTLDGPAGGGLEHTPDDLFEVVTADLDHPETLDAAMTGISTLFLLSPGPTNTPAQDAHALEAAQRMRVGHVVLLSSLGVEHGGIGGGEAHAPGEELLLRSGMTWTLLRPSELMTNTLAWLPEIQARGTISVPSGHGKVGLVAPADIASVAFTALTTPGHAGMIYRLTGPEALTTADLAARIGAVIGKPVQHLDVSDAEFRAFAQAARMPEAVVAILSEYYAALKQGAMDILAPDIAQVTGHPATTYAAWARDTFPVA